MLMLLKGEMPPTKTTYLEHLCVKIKQMSAVSERGGVLHIHVTVIRKIMTFKIIQKKLIGNGQLTSFWCHRIGK